jgi:hypothetical protein
MIPNPFGSGKLEKMIIQALTTDEPPEVSDAEDDKYMVQVNPESYKVHYQVNYDRQPTHGTSGADAKYANTSPPTLEFEFLFDGTGVIPPPAGPLDGVPIAGAVASLFSDDEAYDVSRELRRFAHVVYDYDGSEHRPRKVRLVWGTLSFDGALTSLVVDYKLFKPDGSPLRAVARATFLGTIADRLRELKENNSSPDLTHRRTVVAGDTLPLMAHRIYRTPKYYIEVARANRLYTFRKLAAGAELAFPPVDKKAK